MKIALVADEDPGWGGIGTYTGILGAALRDLGHHVELILRGWGEDETSERGDLPVCRVAVAEPSWRRGTVGLTSRLYVARESLAFSAGVARVVADKGFDLVETPEFHAAGLIAGLRKHLVRRLPPVVARLHAPSFLTARLAAERGDFDGRAVEFLEAVAVGCAQQITAPSRAMAALVARRWPWAQRAVVVPNPVDAELFTPGAEEVAGRILVVGRIERGKGQDLMVEALPAIRAAVPAAHLRLVGDDGGAADAVQARARALGVAEAVQIVGPVARRALPEEYRTAAVCAVPSRFEAFGYTCVEAMACGRAVVAAAVGGLPEVVGDEGLLVAAQHPPALASGVISLLSDGAARERLGAAARERVLAEFASASVAARMLAHYEELTG